MTNRAKTKLISRKVEFEGWHTLETVVLQPASMQHDGLTPPMTREIYHCKTVAVGLLYQPETDEILLNEQFRAGAFIAGDNNPWLYECCAGVVEKDEDPEAAMKREAREETGCDILDLEFIGKAYPSPGGSNEIFLLYCCRIKGAETGHYGVEAEGEEIQTHLFPAVEAIRLLDTGKITNGGTVMCLHWFARNHQRLRQKWGKS